MAFHDRRIEPPRYWEAFEDLCLDLYREVWSDPSAQISGAWAALLGREYNPQKLQKVALSNGAP